MKTHQEKLSLATTGHRDMHDIKPRTRTIVVTVQGE